MDIKKILQIDNDLRDKAFLLQFLGDDNDVEAKLELYSYIYNIDVVNDMKKTGLFGILDVLFDLGLTKEEIMSFYIHGHVEPYTDPYEFTKGIIEIANGMPKTEIKDKYGYYFKDERISKFPNLNRNIQMLMYFCYDKDDIYEFIPDKEDLSDRFLDNYNKCYYNSNNNINEKSFQKIDGKLFRTIHFLVRSGYDFPMLEELFNENITDIVIKQNGKDIFTLNKEYARQMSNDLLSFVFF